MSEKKQGMNLPNRLTIARLCCVPVYLAVMLIDAIPYNILWGGVIFALAMITDLLDGKIARKYNMVTNFGKFWDPLADKLMTITALIALAAIKEDYILSTIIAVVVLCRELLVTGLRMIASSEGGKVIAANIWGKLKTVSQTIYISLEMFLLFFRQTALAENTFYITYCEPILQLLAIAVGIVMLLLTLYSGLTYFRECKQYLKG